MAGNIGPHGGCGSGSEEGAAIRIITEPDMAGLARRGADLFARFARESVSQRGRFAVALSGGSTPRPMYRLLGKEPFVSTVPWEMIHVFWVDERWVPRGDPASNYGAARADFLDRVPIPSDQVHPMPVEGATPERGAEAYEREVALFFQTRPPEIPVFDLLCLGMGTDGHTASLFPGDPAAGENRHLVTAVRGGDPHVARITMTFPMINHAREILFLVSGREKAPILKAVLEGPAGRFPAQMVHPVGGNLTFLTDLEAASMLRP